MADEPDMTARLLERARDLEGVYGIPAEQWLRVMREQWLDEQPESEQHG